MTSMTNNSSPSLDAALSAYHEVSARIRRAYDELAGEVSRLHDELAHKNRELERRERLAALGQLAAGLAHEVRNPLGGIALYASMLQRDLHDRPAERELVGKIARGVQSLDRLVNEILEFAQEERIEPETIRFGELMSSLNERLAGWVAEREIVIDVTPGSEAVALWADASRLERALLNIVINAIQAMDERGRVIISAQAGADGAIIEIGDSGPGIPEDRLGRIFDPFFTTRASGTGLGLAIVHRIIEAHGGAIRVGNEPGGGAVFTLTLPGRSASASPGRPVQMRSTGWIPTAATTSTNRKAS